MREKRSVGKYFRLTPRESQMLAKHAAKAELSESDYVRTLIVDPSHVFTTSRDILVRIHKDIRKAGVNLNQIAWKCNSGHVKEVRREELKRIAETNEQMLDLLADALKAKRS